MKIKSVRARALEARAKESLHFGVGAFPTFSATIVEVETSDGVIGRGEAIARMAPRVTKQIVDDMLALLLVGKDPRDVEGLWEAMFNRLRRWGHSRGFLWEAISGVDIALWDILGQHFQVPVYKLLFGQGRERVPCYASSIYYQSPEKTRELAKAQVAAGHTGIKVKVGRTPEQGGLATDVETVKIVREAVGPQVQIMLDANGAYDAAGAIHAGEAFHEYDITWFEEPVPPDDHEGYARIRHALTIPIAGGESEFSVFGFRDLIEKRGIDILQPDIARAGGFTACRRIAALASAYNLPLALHTGLSGGLCHLAALHLAAALPNCSTYEYMFISNPLRDIFVEPFPTPENGQLAVPQGPGLGLTLNEELIQAYELRE